MSNSDNHTILFVGQNLVFLGRVENLAEPLGYDVRRATSETAFWDSFGSSPPALILVDLEGDEAVWGKVLEGIHRQESAKSRVVAFGPHENVAAMERARSLGCDQVLSKGEFNRDLPKIISAGGPEAGS